MGKMIFYVLALALLVSGTASAQENGGDVPRFEPGPCTEYGSFDDQMICGDLIVPEDRADPESDAVRLAVAVSPADREDAEPDPLIYLSGGPGGFHLIYLDFWADHFRRANVNRDIIFLDQRGVGFSDPQLDCPEVLDAVAETIGAGLPLLKKSRAYADALIACHDRFIAEGIDLAAYTSADNAADIADLIRTLGYERANLFGISYGTRLALTVLRDYPDLVRSLVLDSTVPPQAPFFANIIPNALHTMTRLFDQCAAESACASAFPNLEARFYSLVSKLREQPIVVDAESPVTGDTMQLVIDDEALFMALFYATYSDTNLPYIPATVDQLARGELSRYLVSLVLNERYQWTTLSEAMFYSVRCSEEMPFANAADVIASTQAHPEFADYMFYNYVYPVCDAWTIDPPNPVETQPVTGDAPVLVLAGEFDPITPPESGKLAADSLENGYFFEFPGLSHGVTVQDDCPLNMALDFIRDPSEAPDAGCIERLDPVEFYISEGE
jgi:pimeloyl-ACP methyl ester carboxylesterase